MANWTEFEAEAPELAAAARRSLGAHTHKTIATVRSDGSPRINGIECRIEDASEPPSASGRPTATRRKPLARRIAVGDPLGPS
jgi:hypothetical protein